MRITVENRTATRLPDLAVRALARRAVRTLNLPAQSVVSVTVVPDSVMRYLNRRTRGVGRTTDVLAFPLWVRRPFRAGPDGIVALGDVVLSKETARRQAAERQAPLREELRALLVHGLLHLVGFHHRRAADARRMERAARALLGER